MERLEKFLNVISILFVTFCVLFYVGFIGWDIGRSKYKTFEEENQTLKNTITSLEESIRDNKKLYYEKGVKDTLNTAAQGNHGIWLIDPLSGNIQFQWHTIRIVPAPIHPIEEIPPAINLPTEGKDGR